MKCFALWLILLLSVGSAVAQEAEAKLPRDRFVRASHVDPETAKRAIAAIRSYRDILASKDYRRFYCECVHSRLKQRVSEDRFTAQIATAPRILIRFFDDILRAYEEKGDKDEDFQIGAMSDSLVPGALMIQFADRIDAEPKTRWPEGAPLRIQMADDNGFLRFHDID